jgi:hypothetical protein
LINDGKVDFRHKINLGGFYGVCVWEKRKEREKMMGTIFHSADDKGDRERGRGREGASKEMIVARF